MAHLTKRPPGKKAQEFMESLGFHLQDSCSSGFSLWAHGDYGEVFLPLKKHPETILELLAYVHHSAYTKGRSAGRLEAMEAAVGVLRQGILKNLPTSKKERDPDGPGHVWESFEPEEDDDEEDEKQEPTY